MRSLIGCEKPSALMMFDRHCRNLTRCKCEWSALSAFMVITIIQVIFCNDFANGTQETQLERPPLKARTPIFEMPPTMATLATASSGTTKTCITRGCYSAASTILMNMDRNVEPCDDFYKYACGGFIESRNISGSTLDFFEITADNVREQLRNVVEAGNEDSDPKSFKLAKIFYRSCINETAIEVRDLKSLREYLGNLGGWPVLVGPSWNEDDSDWKNITYALREGGHPFAYLMALKVKDSSKQILKLDQGTLGLSRIHLRKGFDNRNVSAYYNYMVDVAKMLRANSAKEELKESLIFEMKLANISSSAKEHRNETYYNLTTLSELMEKYPNAPWKDYFTRLLPATTIFEEDKVVIEYAPSYITNLMKLIDETKKRVLANYLIWRAIDDLVEYLNEDMRKRQQTFFEILYGSTEFSPKRETCFQQVVDEFPEIIKSMYVRKHFNEEAKKSATSMAMNIQEQFIETIKNTTWLGHETKRYAVEKVEAMLIAVGYSDGSLDSKKLDGIYGKLEFSEDDYLGNVLKTSRFNVDRGHSPSDGLKSRNDWETDTSYVTDVNGYYYRSINGIQIPAGLLQDPFFSDDRPKYVNYGAAGSIIGHEFAHGLTGPIKHFDKYGNSVDWWSSAAAKNYLERAQCIIDQYSNYSIGETGNKVDGVDSQDENIANNEGFRVAYYAYKKEVERNGPEPTLPGIDESAEQLFWLSAATVLCSKNGLDQLDESQDMEGHIPKEFQVLGSFQNLEEFSIDFKCAKGSNMNPSKKCLVYGK